MLHVFVYTYHIFLIHSSVGFYVSGFYVLAVVNSAATNIGVHISFQVIVVSVYIPRRGIAGSYGNSFFSFFFVFWLFFFFLGLHPQHMEVPKLGVESEL